MPLCFPKEAIVRTRNANRTKHLEYTYVRLLRNEQILMVNVKSNNNN